MINSTRVFEPWTPAENDLVHSGVAKHGKVWANIQRDFLPWRTARQIKRHFINILDPSISRSEWTKEEIKKFKKLCIAHPRKWTVISKSLPGRSPQDVRLKFRYLESKNDGDSPKAKKQKKKHYWIKAEDELLLDGVKKHGLSNWSIIKKEFFPNLSKKQLIVRHKNLTSESNIAIKKESKKRIDRPEPEPKRRRLALQPPQTPALQPPQTPIEIKVQDLISDFLLQFKQPQ